MEKAKYTGLDSFSHGLAAVARNGKWGYVNTSGEEVISCQFPYAEHFHVRDYAVVRDEDYRAGIINRAGDYVMKPEYNLAKIFKNSSLIGLWKNDSPYWKVFNPKNGRILGEYRRVGNPMLSMVDYGYSGLIPVKNDIGKWGLINEDGDLIVPFQYDALDNNNYGRCENDITGKYFVASIGGKLIEQYDDEINYRGCKYGLIAQIGEVMLDFKYDELYCHSDDCIIIGKGMNYETRKYGVITLSGKTVLPCKYSWIYVGDSIICFEDYKTEKWGFADIHGRILAEPQFYKDHFCGFSDGLMRVYNRKFKNQGKAGCVNKSGELVIPYKFFSRNDPPAWVGEFHDGLADYALSNDKRGWINKVGDIVIPPIYDTACTRFGEEGMVPVSLDGELFYIDRTGSRCLPHVTGHAEKRLPKPQINQEQEYEDAPF